MKKTHLVLILLAVTHGLFALGESCPYENEKGYIPQDIGLQLIKDLKEKRPIILNGTKMKLIETTQVTRWGNLESINAVKFIRTEKQNDGTTRCRYNLEKTPDFSKGMGSFKFEVLLSPDVTEADNHNVNPYKNSIGVGYDGSWKAF